MSIPHPRTISTVLFPPRSPSRRHTPHGGTTTTSPEARSDRHASNGPCPHGPSRSPPPGRPPRGNPHRPCSRPVVPHLWNPWPRSRGPHPKPVHRSPKASPASPTSTPNPNPPTPPRRHHPKGRRSRHLGGYLGTVRTPPHPPKDAGRRNNRGRRNRTRALPLPRRRRRNRPRGTVAARGAPRSPAGTRFSSGTDDVGFATGIRFGA